MPAEPAPDKLLPAYPLARVARFVGSNPATLRAWFHGRNYQAGGEKRRSKPMLDAGGKPGSPMSFIDLVEAHVLILIRKGYGIPMRNCRAAMDTLKEIGGSLLFLAHKDFMHDRRHLYVKIDERLVCLSERGQNVDKTIIAEGLKQLLYGEDGFADRFYPIIGGHQQQAVMLCPTIGFGEPTLSRLGVNTEAIAQRFYANEPIDILERDYGATREEIEYAIRCSRQFAGGN